MKQSIIIPLVIGLITVYFAFFLNKRAADVQFDLSRPIILEAATDKPEKVAQQLEVGNTGNTIAQKLRIKIKSNVSVISVIKDSQSDKYELFPAQPDATELDYDGLRPSGRIRISISANNPLQDSDIEIQHQDGVASPDLMFRNKPYIFIFGFILFASFLYNGYTAVLDLRKSLFAIKCRYHPIEAIKGKLPFLLNEKTRIECLQDAARELKHGSFSEKLDNIPAWGVFKLLDGAPPEKLTANIWEQLLPILTNALEAKIVSSASSAHISGDYKALRSAVAIDKPAHVFDESWESMRRKLSEMYTSSLVINALRYSWRRVDLQEVCKSLGTLEAETKGLSDSSRKHAIEWLRILYYTGILDGITNSFDKTEYLSAHDTRILLPEQLKALKEIVEVRDKANENEKTRLTLSSKLRETERAYTESCQLREKVLRQLDIIDRVTNGRPPSDDPVRMLV